MSCSPMFPPVLCAPIGLRAAQFCGSAVLWLPRFYVTDAASNERDSCVRMSRLYASTSVVLVCNAPPYERRRERRHPTLAFVRVMRSCASEAVFA